MGNTMAKLGGCLTCQGEARRKHDAPVLISNPLEEDLGHAFCYVRPDPNRSSLSKVHSDETPTFRTISGASVSANTSTPLSTAFSNPYVCSNKDPSATFESSASFSSNPLLPIPRNQIGWSNSGPLSGQFSGPDVGLASVSIEQGFMCAPSSSTSVDRGVKRSFSHGSAASMQKQDKKSLIRVLRRAISNTISRGGKSIVAPFKEFVRESNSAANSVKKNCSFKLDGADLIQSSNLEEEKEGTDDDDDDDENVDYDSSENQNLEWAQGKAGEDRVHIVVSEEHEWVFVGIYDGFNGPDAPDYLLSNLYTSIEKEVKGLLWDDRSDSSSHLRSKSNDTDVLKALSRALRRTEESYLEIADTMLIENPELALMGSCVLVMLMKGEDIYVMNVGDSRAVLAQKIDPNDWVGKIKQEAERYYSYERWPDRISNAERLSNLTSYLTAFQLSVDHCTSAEEEVERIRKEHPDDSSTMINDRVKGSLNVTRAFGAGFLKKPKWNNALLETFKIDYIGNSPYLTCLPSLFHHRLGARDRFLLLSSDGLYQYFTNEEAVYEVELFITLQPEGDPAQHLIEQLLFRAAKKAGMDFHELLDIPHGDRRRYHDDILVIVISLQGRMWRSCI